MSQKYEPLTQDDTLDTNNNNDSITRTNTHTMTKSSKVGSSLTKTMTSGVNKKLIDSISKNSTMYSGKEYTKWDKMVHKGKQYFNGVSKRKRIVILNTIMLIGAVIFQIICWKSYVFGVKYPCWYSICSI